MKEYSVAYRYKDAVYLNITNRCPNSCIFCLKHRLNMKFHDYNLRLPEEPDENEIKKALNNIKDTDFKEIVFCGYGEPTLRYDLILNISRSIRRGEIHQIDSNIKIRLNTNGMGNIVNGKDITLELGSFIDSVSVSLNTIDREQWKKIMRPQEKYAEKGFDSVIEFIKLASKNIKEVTVTAVNLPDVDFSRIEEFARNINVNFRLRTLLVYET